MNYPQQHRYDLPKLIFGVIFIMIMIIASFWVVQPFIMGFAWAGMVVIATWPLLIRLQGLLWGRRSLAVVIMTLLLILLFVIPIALLVSSILENSAPLIKWASSPANLQIPEMVWLKSIPMLGNKLYSSWHTLIAGGGNALMAKVQPYVGETATWFVAQAAHVGRFLLHLTLMVLFSILLYFHGEGVALGIRHFAVRLAEKRGDAAVILAAQAIRAVALGVVVTALVQGILGGIGLAIAGIPYAMLLTVVMFVCCVAQLGPLLVLVPAVIWLYWSGDNTFGTLLLVWSCVVGTLDGVLRPVLIRMGADLPMILILSGVIGGLLSFGMIGLFIGPVVLAVSYRLVTAWIHEAPEPVEDVAEVAKHLDEL
ncbi:AI-2E family transporter YdiK [Yersinia nurmii]|uniref:AI-2E family transporter YdiK n=1 Tax=Yersinia nurmii TaxID=685706 RepID=A0AAW7K833_9GAMM|nr:AI-2E family transporter YdiK [Yersinia nurmii]MDN0087286.1 AI-2E family transporter YdiK [Yersinia nurmii]CNE90004.1 putative inner membrane protein [Yersinia nurmii]